MAENYTGFISQIKKKLGIDLSLYKEAQMKRRITSLRDKRGFKTFSLYFQALNRDDDLLEEFVDRMTINVSEFYRNPKRWEVLKDSVFPFLLTDKKKLRVWSAACSTGEEPYSLAIMMKEYFPQVQIEIIATDLDDKVLARAKEGQYNTQVLKDLPENLKEKYFKKNNTIFHIDKNLQNSITFKKHNLLLDTYPRNVDLIVCRNVLIYFTDEAKDIIYRNFSKALNTNGVLFVGSTEQIFNPNRYDYDVFDTFFYRKIDYSNK